MRYNYFKVVDNRKIQYIRFNYALLLEDYTTEFDFRSNCGICKVNSITKL
jgi:hypothetical protein